MLSYNVYMCWFSLSLCCHSYFGTIFVSLRNSASRWCPLHRSFSILMQILKFSSLLLRQKLINFVKGQFCLSSWSIKTTDDNMRVITKRTLRDDWEAVWFRCGTEICLGLSCWCCVDWLGNPAFSSGQCR